MDNTIGLLLILCAFILALLITLKTYFFYRSTHKPTFRKWFFFTRKEIATSSSGAKSKKKRIQNRYSFGLVLFIVFSLLLFALFIQN